ncbi:MULTISPECIES: flagellar motor switch protein FliN [Rahnella]|uniref:Flagellar motor switch protein FliN n=1 Tax=Rahnella laticis TaxID=2787622 RepID=A0ABS0E053_9GAMM|nr:MULTISPECIES: flagellar motor switch protein FliN [Rahnella]MBF7978487.1 flagellar motor switch protein FliN [Rahnella laticis]MBF7998577.1 flagellar motor switch protein FliN [Rahnella sp. LAC-M12]
MTDHQDDLPQDLDLNFDLSDTLAPAMPASAARSGGMSESELFEKKRKLSLFSRIPVTLTLEVASVNISLADLMAVNNESVIELDKMAGEPLDIKVNGILFGKAEVVVLNDKYGLRIIEFNNKELGELAL